MTAEQLQNIQKMEEILNETIEFNKEMTQFLEKWQNIHPKVEKLFAYYGSDQLTHDIEAWYNDEIPQNVSCEVLGEDLTHITLGDYYQLSTEILKLATQIIARNRDFNGFSVGANNYLPQNHNFYYNKTNKGERYFAPTRHRKIVFNFLFVISLFTLGDMFGNVPPP